VCFKDDSLTIILTSRTHWPTARLTLSSTSSN